MAEGDSSPAGGLGDLFTRLQEARADLEAQAEAIDAAVVEGHAAGGAVVVRLSGSLEAESVHIDPSIIDAADPTLLEDAVLAALPSAGSSSSGLRCILRLILPLRAGSISAVSWATSISRVSWRASTSRA
jgi:DNA-binding protein YbaB